MNWPAPLTSNSKSALWLNRLLRCCMERELVPGAGYGIERLGVRGSGLIFPWRGRGRGGGSGVTIKRFRISSVQEKYLNCVKPPGVVDEDQPATAVIAKPPGLWPDRGAYYDYAFDEDNTQEAYNSRKVLFAYNGVQRQFLQLLCPPYQAFEDGPYCYVTAAKVGGQHYEGSGDIPSTEWVDLNIDGRTWQTEHRPFAVCVDGAAQVAVVSAGAPNLEA